MPKSQFTPQAATNDLDKLLQYLQQELEQHSLTAEAIQKIVREVAEDTTCFQLNPLTAIHIHYLNLATLRQ